VARILEIVTRWSRTGAEKNPGGMSSHASRLRRLGMENVISGSGSQIQAPRLWGRSVGAVVAGLVAIVVSHTGTDAVLHAIGVYPPAGQTMSSALFGLAATYRIVLSVLGCALTARLAPARPLAHTLVLGGIGTLGSLAGLLATLGKGPEFGPLWYPLLLAVTALPCAWLGAKVAARRSSLAR
jgi:hypothetical protein